MLRLLRGDGTSFDAEVMVVSYTVEEGEAGNKDGLCIAYRDDVAVRATRDASE